MLLTCTYMRAAWARGLWSLSCWGQWHYLEPPGSSDLKRVTDNNAKSSKGQATNDLTSACRIDEHVILPISHCAKTVHTHRHVKHRNAFGLAKNQAVRERDTHTHTHREREKEV